jgi:hypothetical protein
MNVKEPRCSTSDWQNNIAQYYAGAGHFARKNSSSESSLSIHLAVYAMSSMSSMWVLTTLALYNAPRVLESMIQTQQQVSPGAKAPMGFSVCCSIESRTRTQLLAVDLL